jgi:signal peptidase II
MTPRIFGFAIAAALIAADQASKLYILDLLRQDDGSFRAIVLTPFLNIVLVWNRGVSFGLLDTDSTTLPWVLAAVALLVAFVLGVWLWRTTRRWTGFALGLIIGGALGNAIDRLRFGAVVDFIDFHVGTWHWPAFNVADSAIVIGVGLLLFESVFEKRPVQS